MVRKMQLAERYQLTDPQQDSEQGKGVSITKSEKNFNRGYNIFQTGKD